jgi:hypothetical protein
LLDKLPRLGHAARRHHFATPSSSASWTPLSTSSAWRRRSDRRFVLGSISTAFGDHSAAFRAVVARKRGGWGNARRAGIVGLLDLGLSPAEFDELHRRRSSPIACSARCRHIRDVPKRSGGSRTPGCGSGSSPPPLRQLRPRGRRSRHRRLARRPRHPVPDLCFLGQKPQVEATPRRRRPHNIEALRRRQSGDRVRPALQRRGVTARIWRRSSAWSWTWSPCPAVRYRASSRSASPAHRFAGPTAPSGP